MSERGLIEDNLRKKLWNIVRKESGSLYYDKVHGIKHVREVYKNFLFFLSEKPKVDRDVLEAAECAVILHDSIVIMNGK